MKKAFPLMIVALFGLMAFLQAGDQEWISLFNGKESSIA